MSSVYVNNEITEQLCLVRHFILVDYREQHKSCVQIHVHLLTSSITSEMCIVVYVDKNTLYLPFKRKATVENKNQIYANTCIQSKTKINLKISFAVKGQIHVNLSKLT